MVSKRTNPSYLWAVVLGRAPLLVARRCLAWWLGGVLGLCELPPDVLLVRCVLIDILLLDRDRSCLRSGVCLPRLRSFFPSVSLSCWGSILWKFFDLLRWFLFSLSPGDISWLGTGWRGRHQRDWMLGVQWWCYKSWVRWSLSTSLWSFWRCLSF